MRMQGDFKGSLGYFKKARTNYKKIGDKVSYAYTLWGEGSAFLMLGRSEDALKDFKEAKALFRQTKDKRGLVYCQLTIGQIEFARNEAKGVKTLAEAYTRARDLKLAVEARYAKTLLAAAEKDPSALPMNLA